MLPQSTITRYVKSLTSSSNMPSTVFLDSAKAESDIDKANLFNTYFYSVFNPSSCSLNVDDLPVVHNSLNKIIFTESEVYYALINLDPSKASGVDEIGPRVLTSCASALCKPFHHLFNVSLKYGVVPSQWCIHKIIPVYKSGDSSSVRNYRSISLLSITSKVLEHLIFDKMINFINSFIT